MSDLVEMNAGQAEQMRFLEETWPEYGHSLQVAAAFSGGMAWKTVRDVEYLVRYHSEDGKKKFTSYGRRSPKTEDIYRRWEETTGRARRVIKDKKDEVALACRLAKAHGIARLPGRHAEMIERCWYLDVTKRLSLFGGTALLAYEGRAGALAPAPLVKEDRLYFVARVDPDDLGLNEIVDVVCDVDGSGCAAKRGRDRISIATTDGQPRAEIYLPGYFRRRAEDDYQAEAYALAIDAPRWNGLTIARDGRPVAVTALEPASYVALSWAMGGGDLWADRSETAVRMKVRIDQNVPEAEAPDERLTIAGAIGISRIR